MVEGTGSVTVKALVAQTSAVLLTRGLEVEPVAVRDVVTHMLGTVAERVGMDVEEAVHLVTAETVADAIVAAADPRAEGSGSVHAVRPVRVDARTVQAGVAALGRLVVAVSQAGKYASLNGDGRSATHAMDLASEIGAVLAGGALRAEDARLSVGVLDEAAVLLRMVASRIESGGWSICPCGQAHEQDDVDEGAVAAMRRDAALARDLRARVGG